MNNIKLTQKEKYGLLLLIRNQLVENERNNEKAYLCIAFQSVVAYNKSLYKQVVIYHKYEEVLPELFSPVFKEIRKEKSNLLPYFTSIWDANNYDVRFSYVDKAISQLKTYTTIQDPFEWWYNMTIFKQYYYRIKFKNKATYKDIIYMWMKN